MRSAIFIVFGMAGLGVAHAELQSAQVAYSYYNQVSNYVNGDLFTFNEAINLQDIKFNATGSGLANLVTQDTIQATLYVSKFTGLGTTPADMNPIWSGNFAVPAGNNSGFFDFTPSLRLAAGQYAVYAIPSLGGTDASSVGLEITSSFVNEAFYSYSWRSRSVRAFAYGMRFDGPITYEGNNGASFNLSTSLVAAVPESETYAMLLAGLGLIGSTLKRRKGVRACVISA